MRLLPRFSIAAIAALAVLTTASAGVNTPQSGWYSGNPLLGPNALRDIACGGSTCYASGDFGALLKSTDGGSTWTGIVTGLSLNLRRVGLAGGSPDKVIIASDCALRRSDDGGEHFSRLPFTARDVGCPARVEAFSFPTDKVGYVALADGNILATTDGGRSWSRRTNRAVTDLLCLSATTCLATWGGGIARTSDGGASWTPVESTPVAMGRLAAAGPLTLYAGGQASYISKSTDGGQTWTTDRLNGVSTNNITDIECGDEVHCLMAAEGFLFRTDDGGVSGTIVTPSNGPLFAVGFASSSRALAAGASGTAHVSNDAGATWSLVGTRIDGLFHVLAATAPTVAYAGGEQGVARSHERRGPNLVERQSADERVHRQPGGLRARPGLRVRGRRLARAVGQRRPELQPPQPGHVPAGRHRRDRSRPAAAARPRGCSVDERRRQLHARRRKDRPCAVERGRPRRRCRVRLRPCPHLPLDRSRERTGARSPSRSAG